MGQIMYTGILANPVKVLMRGRGRGKRRRARRPRSANEREAGTSVPDSSVFRHCGRQRQLLEVATIWTADTLAKVDPSTPNTPVIHQPIRTPANKSDKAQIRICSFAGIFEHRRTTATL